MCCNKDKNYREINQNLYTVIIYISKIRIFPITNMLQPGKALKQRLGGTRGYNQDKDIRESFGDKVGWRKGGHWLNYNEITYDKKAPEGHLPSPCDDFWFGSEVFSMVFSRVETCRL